MRVTFYVPGFSVVVEEPTLLECIETARSAGEAPVAWLRPPPPGTWRVDRMDVDCQAICPLTDVIIDGQPPTAEQAAVLDAEWPGGCE